MLSSVSAISAEIAHMSTLKGRLNQEIADVKDQTVRAQDDSLRLLERFQEVKDLNDKAHKELEQRQKLVSTETKVRVQVLTQMQQTSAGQHKQEVKVHLSNAIKADKSKGMLSTLAQERDERLKELRSAAEYRQKELSSAAALLSELAGVHQGLARDLSDSSKELEERDSEARGLKVAFDGKWVELMRISKDKETAQRLHQKLSSDAEKKRKSLESERTQTTGKILELEGKHQSDVKLLDELDAAIVCAQKQTGENTASIKKTSDEITTVEAEAASNYEEFQKSKDALEAEKSFLYGSIEELDTRNRNLTKEALRNEEAHKVMRKSIDDNGFALKESQSILSQSQASVAELTMERDDGAARLNALLVKKQEYEAAATSTIIQVSEACATATQGRDVSSEEVESLQKKKAELESAVSQRTDAIKQLKDDRLRLEKAKEESTKHNTESSVFLSKKLKTALAAYQSEVDREAAINKELNDKSTENEAIEANLKKTISTTKARLSKEFDCRVKVARLARADAEFNAYLESEKQRHKADMEIAKAEQNKLIRRHKELDEVKKINDEVQDKLKASLDRVSEAKKRAAATQHKLAELQKLLEVAQKENEETSN